MKLRKRFLISTLLVLCSICILTLSVKAAITPPSANSMIINQPSATVFKLAEETWQVIKYDGTVVTLLKQAQWNGKGSRFGDPLKKDPAPNLYATSSVRSATLALLSNFSSIEEKALLPTDLPDVGVTGDKIWLLSKDEVNSLHKDLRAISAVWWTRSASGTGANSVYAGGSIQVQTVGNGNNIRPAVRIDLSKVPLNGDGTATNPYTIATYVEILPALPQNAGIAKMTSKINSVAATVQSSPTESAVLGNIKAGETVTLTGVPATGYKIKEWKVIEPEGLTLSSPFTNGTTFRMPADVNVVIQPVFEGNPNQFTIEKAEGGTATATFSDGQTVSSTLDANGVLIPGVAPSVTGQLTANTEPGYIFSKWVVKAPASASGFKLAADGSFTMPFGYKVIIAPVFIKDPNPQALKKVELVSGGTITPFETIEEALDKAKAQDTIKVYPGEFDVKDTYKGATSLLLADVSNLTIMGVDSNGNEILDPKSTQAKVFSTTSYTPFNFIDVTADNVTIKGLNIMQKNPVSNTINVTGNNFILENSYLTPSTNPAGNEQFGAKINIMAQVSGATIKNNVFKYSGIHVASGTIDINNNDFTARRMANGVYQSGTITLNTTSGSTEATINVSENTFSAEGTRIVGNTTPSMNIDKNYWGGNNPVSSGIVTNATPANYYTDEAKTDLVTIP